METKVVERTFFENTKRFFLPLSQNKSLYLIGAWVYFLWGFNSVIHVVFLERIINALEGKNIDYFTSILYFYAFYIVGYALLVWVFRKRGWTEISDTAIQAIQNIYVKKFIYLDNNSTEKLGTGKLIAILNKGMERWGRLMDDFIRHSINILISVVFTCYMIGRNSYKLLFIFLGLYIVIYFISYILNLYTLKYRRKRRDNANIHTKNLVKTIMSKNDILFTGKVQTEIDTLDYYKQKEIFYNKKMSDFLIPFFELPNFTISCLILFTFYVFGQSYFQGTLELASIVGIASALIIMQGAIEDGIRFFKDFTKEFVDIEKLWDFFDTTPEIQGYDIGKKFKHTSGEIEIKNLSYGYNSENKVFDNFSLQIPGEQVTAIVGVSGGGKSTLVKLISGYIRADEGEIIIDGQKLSEISLKSYYKDIGYLTQEPSVFDGTVIENLCYALNKKPTKKKLDEIIKLAKCEFIYDFPNGLETEIGEKGIRLSGGQRQRLAIAKIFLKNPKIIILDEPTSALDSFSEEQITIAMHNLFKGRTVIIIAHRLQTVKSADDIILIEDGQVKERGTHASLVRKKGVYKKMLDLQSGF